MHAIKVGWVGQTFALAKSNESEGRKSRIRRSKKERKAMVESFIKKYQKLNNGSFPSLNLTHKEVGGSFYTVREIVRDIIQENRVLGPAKLTQEKQSSHQLEQGPLGSIALEPEHLSIVLSNGSEFVTNKYKISEEPSLVSDGHQATPEHQIFGNGEVINGTQVDTEKKGLGELKDEDMLEVVELVVELEQNANDDELDENEDLVSDGNYASPKPTNGTLVDVRTKESHEVNKEELHGSTQKELQVNEASEAENVEEESKATRSKVTPIAGDVKVETFPVRPVNRKNGLDERSSEVKDMANTFSEQGTEKVDLFTDVGSSQIDGINSSHKEKGEETISDPPLDKHSGLVNEEVVEEHLDPPLGRSNYSNESAGHEVLDLKDATIKVSADDLTSVTSEQSVAVAGGKVVNSPIDMKTKYAGHRNGTTGQSKTEGELIEKESEVQLSGKLQKESNTTLDRINLESWDGASKKSGPQGNPLWAVVKAFISTFLKFWTE